MNCGTYAAKHADLCRRLTRLVDDEWRGSSVSVALVKLVIGAWKQRRCTSEGGNVFAERGKQGSKWQTAREVHSQTSIWLYIHGDESTQEHENQRTLIQKTST